MPRRAGPKRISGGEQREHADADQLQDSPAPRRAEGPVEGRAAQRSARRRTRGGTRPRSPGRTAVPRGRARTDRPRSREAPGCEQAVVGHERHGAAVVERGPHRHRQPVRRGAACRPRAPPAPCSGRGARRRCRSNPPPPARASDQHRAGPRKRPRLDSGGGLTTATESYRSAHDILPQAAQRRRRAEPGQQQVGPQAGDDHALVARRAAGGIEERDDVGEVDRCRSRPRSDAGRPDPDTEPLERLGECARPERAREIRRAARIGVESRARAPAAPR